MYEDKNESDCTSSILAGLSLLSQGTDNFNSSDELIPLYLEALRKILSIRFISFVEKKENDLKVVSQIGDSSAVVNLFDKKSSENIYEWVINHGKYASLSLAQGDKFIFIPVIDLQSLSKIVYGMVVINLENSSFEIDPEIGMAIEICTRLACMSFSRIVDNCRMKKTLDTENKIEVESKILNKIQKSLSGNMNHGKFMFSVLERENALFDGSVWWIGELSSDIVLVLFAQIQSKGLPSSMLSGYLLGEMNLLKNNSEIALHPARVLDFLNKQFNSIFVSTGITLSAWYGVFNLEARKVRFGNANHPSPFLIGHEQQVSALSNYEKGQALGINTDNIYMEHDLFLSQGSKLIICTEELLEEVAKVGNRYDPTWFPQILETIGSLSVTDMKKSLDDILSENMNGTAEKSSRLALLLELNH